ncbi:vignain-like [Syzygium oleosum]|uniref:vignain-like n=1 Tax=Syzygium oleosum TaxID=219896 RepID=UPI0024B9F54F|nr:vignain-like [Syzygium oleosum]
MSGGRATNNIDKHNRFNVFKQKIMHVHLVNQQDKPYKLKLNKFADMTNHELRSSCAGADDDHHRMFHGAQRGSASIMYEDDTLVPPSIDWREKGTVTDVMHQRQYAAGARQQVNSCVKKQTKGLIEKLVPPGSIDSDTQLVLCERSLFFTPQWRLD